MPWRSVTLVPFIGFGAASGSLGEVSPEVEVISDSVQENHLESPQASCNLEDVLQEHLGLDFQSEAQDGDAGSVGFSLPDELDPSGRLGDFRANLVC